MDLQLVVRLTSHGQTMKVPKISSLLLEAEFLRTIESLLRHTLALGLI